MCHLRPLFLYFFFSLYKSLTKVADAWIWTLVLWYRKRPTLSTVPLAQSLPRLCFSRDWIWLRQFILVIYFRAFQVTIYNFLIATNLRIIWVTKQNYYFSHQHHRHHLLHTSSSFKFSARYCLWSRCLQNSKNSISRVKFFRTISFVGSATGGL